MSTLWNMLFYLVFFGLNTGFSIWNFMTGNIPLGVFNGVVAVWCMAFMITYIVKGVMEE